MKKRILFLLICLNLSTDAFSAEAQQGQPANAPSASAPAPAQAQAQFSNDAQKFALAHQLLELSHFSDNFKFAFDLMTKSLMPIIARANPNQNQKVQTIVLDAFKKAMVAHIGELENNSAMLYANAYTLDELQKITAFYQTDVGQKMVTTMPQLMQQSLALNQGVILKAAKEGLQGVVKQLKANGLVVPKDLGI